MMEFHKVFQGDIAEKITINPGLTCSACRALKKAI
jgi:hypothetical protein